MKDFQKRLRNKVYSMSRLSEETKQQILYILDREDLEQVAEELMDLVLIKEKKNSKAITLYVERGKKYYSFKCPYCGKSMRRQYIAATSVCDRLDKRFLVKPKKGRKK